VAGEEVEEAEVSSPAQHSCSRTHRVLSRVCRKKRREYGVNGAIFRVAFQSLLETGTVRFATFFSHAEWDSTT
jgi:hypothetical protein